MVQVLVIIHSQKIDLSQKRLFHGQKWQKQANKFLQRSGELSNKNVNVTTIMFLMSGDLTGLCLYI